MENIQQQQNQNNYNQNMGNINQFPQNNNYMNMNMNMNMNNMNNANMGNMMPGMSPQQYQMMMEQQFEMQKMQARQIGQLLRRQKDLVEKMKKREEARKNEDREIILFFNHNYDILPLTFKQSNFVYEVLMKYIEEKNIGNCKFKFEDIELKIDTSAQTLKDIKGLINGSEIIVETE